MRPINAEKLKKQAEEAFKNNPDVLDLLVQWIEMQPTIDLMCADTGECCIVGDLRKVATIYLYESHNWVTAEMLYDGKWVEDHRTGLLLGVVRTLAGMARYSDNPQETRLLIEDMLKEEFKFGDGADEDEDEDANANTIEAKPVTYGRWNTADQNGISIKDYVVCSCCDVMIKKPSVERYGIPILKYCPVCGERMEIETEDEE